MSPIEEHIELKFRIYDGTDKAQSTYAPSTATATLKQRLVSEWPQDKSKDEMPKPNSCRQEQG